MSTPKRKFTEYHDPDYPTPEDGSPVDGKKIKLQFVNDSCENNKILTLKPPSSDDNVDKLKKFQQIIKNEFHKELNLREKEINQIEHKLVQAKRLLQRVRYAIVFNFYTKKNLEYTENEIKNYPTPLNTNTNESNNGAAATNEPLVESFTSNLPIQKPIHPSLKKLLGKKPLDYNEILKIRSPRQAAKTAKTTISEKLRSKKDERKLRSIQQVGSIIQPNINHNEIKIPRYIEPTLAEKGITKINTARGRNQTRHLIAVGNTSKYIGDEESVQGVTHKWLVYVKTKTKSTGGIQIEDILSKVRFFLHPSYKPNDVVEIDCPPFQISRRGWGEFPIRAQLYFQSHIQQKPLQVIHNLILDKGNTGLQTMGAESVLEIWLNLPINEAEVKQSQEIKIKKPLLPQSDILAPKLISQPSTISKSDLNVPTTSIKNCDPILKIDNQNKQNEITTKKENLEKKEEKITINKSISNDGNKCQSDSLPKITNQLIPTKFNNTPTINSSINQPPLPPQKNQTVIKFPPSKPNRKFIKCLNTSGKVTIVEIETDPLNPKNIKVIKDSVDAAKLNKQIADAQNKLTIKTTTPTTITPTTSNHLAQTSKNIKIESNIKSDQVPLISSPVPPPPAPSIQRLPSLLNPIRKIEPPKNMNSLCQKVQTTKTIMSNGNVFIIEKSKLNNQQIKQESLLKPQISLLKPIIKSSQQQLKPLDVNPQQLKPLQQRIPSKSLILSQNIQRKQLILNTAVDIKNMELLTPTPSPPSLPILSKSTISSIKNSSNHKFIITNMKKGFRDELYNSFMERRFNDNNSIRLAVEYLLKKVPLVHEYVQKFNEFVQCFPFAVNSIDTFNQLMLPKQRYYEWCRAKFIKKMLTQHNDLKLLPMWSTKELVLFARQFNYTPKISIKMQLLGSSSSLSPLTINKIDQTITQNNNNNLTKLIQQEFRKEKTECGQIITLNSGIITFIDSWNKKTLNNDNKVYYDHEIDEINIVDDDDDDFDGAQHLNGFIMKNRRKNSQFNKKEQSNEHLGKIMLQIDSSVQMESSWIANICDTTKINLAPEEIVEGVLYPTAQRLLVQVAQSFIEDLIRKASGNKFEYEQLSEKTNETAILPSDIIKTIKNVERFDFLTNKCLGVIELKSEKQ